MQLTFIVLILCLSLRLCVGLVESEFVYERQFTEKCRMLARDPANGFSKYNCGTHRWLIPPEIIEFVDSHLPPGLKEEQAKWDEETKELFKQTRISLGVHLAEGQDVSELKMFRNHMISLGFGPKQSISKG